MGTEMLVGDADFYNGISHDGFKASWQYKSWTLDTWYTKLAESATVFGGPFIFPGGMASDDTDFMGAYATFKQTKVIGFDAYGMILNNNCDFAPGGTCGSASPVVGSKEDRTTLGGRVYSKAESNWDWEAEFAYQTGEFSTAGTDTDISAFAFEGELGYQFDAGIKPHVYIAYNSYSGNDDDASDSEAFNPMFQDFHARNGYFDLFRATNLDVLKLGVSWNAEGDRHTFGVDFLNFTSNEETVLILGVPTDTMEDDLGTEIDLYYKFAYTKNVMIEAAISSFSAGDYFDSAASGSEVFADSSPEIFASGDDSAMRVYANTRLRW